MKNFHIGKGGYYFFMGFHDIFYPVSLHCLAKTHRPNGAQRYQLINKFTGMTDKYGKVGERIYKI